MKRICVVMAALAVTLSASAQSKSFTLGKWVEVQNAILKELNRSYVDSLEVGRIERAGVDAMLEALASGKALDVFRTFVTMQGGNAGCVDDTGIFKQPLYKAEAKASGSGYVAGIKADSIGLASQHLGAGRKTKEDAIDLSAGILLLKKVGDPVEAGEPVAVLFSDDEEKLAAGLAEAESAYTFSAEKPAAPVLIKEIIE